MKVIKKATSRGFLKLEFADLYDASCSIQESSLGTEHAIWIGVDDADPKVMVADAPRVGVHSEAKNGWCTYPIPKEVLLNTRMHLNQTQVKKLLPILQKFVETGHL